MKGYVVQTNLVNALFFVPLNLHSNMEKNFPKYIAVTCIIAIMIYKERGREGGEGHPRISH